MLSVLAVMRPGHDRYLDVDVLVVDHVGPIKLELQAGCGPVAINGVLLVDIHEPAEPASEGSSSGDSMTSDSLSITEVIDLR